jgi:transcriptional regulator with XRE-family HTH domain
MNFEPTPKAPLTRIQESRDVVLARNLVVARLAAGLTQQALADAACVSRATIAQIEAGLSDPRLSTIVELAKAIGVSPVVLLIGEPELGALAELGPRGPELRARFHIPEHTLRGMAHWAGTGLVRDRTRAARMGAEVAQASGGSSQAKVGAAIGSAVRPGDGTVVAAAFADLAGHPNRPNGPETL